MPVNGASQEASGSFESNPNGIPPFIVGNMMIRYTIAETINIVIRIILFVGILYMAHTHLMQHFVGDIASQHFGTHDVIYNIRSPIAITILACGIRFGLAEIFSANIMIK
jgi:hypothetical protein